MKIMVGYDGSGAKEALKLAKLHAEAFKASKLYVLSSLEGDTQGQVANLEKAEQDLAYAEVFLKNSEFETETKLVTFGLSPGEALVEFAKENEVDEIIIGIVKTSKVGKLVFGSTAQYVILKSPCPVVTVK
ncbi:MAG: universal stress protein [Deltaproteobacteria bacterium]|nr:universal stress protein [Deltaproteobacteria bacterium]